MAPFTHAGAGGDAIENFITHVRPLHRRIEGGPLVWVVLIETGDHLVLLHDLATLTRTDRGVQIIEAARCSLLSELHDLIRTVAAISRAQFGLSSAYAPPHRLRGRHRIVYHR